ncbi:MAG: aminotransferase class IV family protein [Spirochaetia bacterium]
MYPLVESIKIENGKPFYLEWHQRRLESAFHHLYKTGPGFQIAQVLTVPSTYREGTVKCRFLYNSRSYKTEFQPYAQKKRDTLKIVHADWIDYSYKYTNRNDISALLNRNRECDDILIVKNGLVTDSSAANIVFKQNSRWLTPASPLLPGTTRARLLAEGEIQEAEITPESLGTFDGFVLINAMIGFNKSNLQKIQNIIF